VCETARVSTRVRCRRRLLAAPFRGGGGGTLGDFLAGAAPASATTPRAPTPTPSPTPTPVRFTQSDSVWAKRRRGFLGPYMNNGRAGVTLLATHVLRGVGVILYPVRLVRSPRPVCLRARMCVGFVFVCDSCCGGILVVGV
jgi:hypothetical protein